MPTKRLGPIKSYKIENIPIEFNDNYLEVYQCPDCNYKGQAKVQESFDFVRLFCAKCNTILNNVDSIK